MCWAPIEIWLTPVISAARLGAQTPEVAKTRVRVNLLNPGPTRTAMRAQAFPGEDPETLQTPQSITGHFVDLAEKSCSKNAELIFAGRGSEKPAAGKTV